MSLQAVRRVAPRAAQGGGFVLGLIVGLLIGLALALGVALYISKVPVPFVDKANHRTPEQDAAEAEKLKDWDPNAGLVGKPVPRPTLGAASDAVAAALPASAASRSLPARPDLTPPRSPRDPAAILSGEVAAPAPATAPVPGVDPFVYFVQAGAFSNPGDAEQQRAKLALQGLMTKVSEREQGGRTVYRVRLGPFERRDEAESAQERLKATGSESSLVRLERSKP
jgi:cell division septation protein DedD